MTKWDSENKYLAYYLLMCEGLTELQENWFPNSMDRFALTTLQGTEKTIKYYTINSVEVLKEKANCYNGNKLSIINTKHRVNNPARIKDGLTWITFMPDLEWLMYNTSNHYANLKDHIEAINIMCRIHFPTSARMVRLNPIALHLYALRTYGISWDYSLDHWNKMVNKSKWFKELRSILVAKGHLPDGTKAYLTNIWEDKYKYGILVKDLRNSIQ